MGCGCGDELTWPETAETNNIIIAFFSDDARLKTTSRINDLKRAFVFLRTHTEQPDPTDV